MCGRYTFFSDPSEIRKYFGVDMPKWVANYNIVPSMDLPIIRLQGNQRQVTLCHWGFFPHWVKDAKKNGPINARAETLHEKPYFRHAFNERRCLVLTNGWYEWQKQDNLKMPFYFHMKNHHPFAFAGLWSHWGDDKTGFDNFAIVTIDAPKPFNSIHHRMPLVLSNHEYDNWLSQDPATVNRNITKNTIHEIEFYPVSVHVNNPKNNSKQCIESISHISP